MTSTYGHFVSAARLALSAIIAAGPAQANAAQHITCSFEEALAADRAVNAIRTWPDLYQTFKAHGHCDDGIIAEGYSDRVVFLLTREWHTIQSFIDLSKTDPAFKQFVFRHIDTLMSRSDARAVTELAAHQCPAAASQICAEIADQASHPDR